MRNSYLLPRLSEFTVVIDTREQHPFHFAARDYSCDSNKNYAPLIVLTKRRTLRTGDYSILGLENLVTVERKSKADLFNCVGNDRARFEREHERMAEMIHAGGDALVVVEASWPSCEKNPPEGSRLCPKVVLRTALSWRVRYRVHWWFANSRAEAERVTFRSLQQFWRIHEENRKQAEREAIAGKN